MIKKLTKLAGLAVVTGAVMLSASNVQAVPITGGISLGGTYVHNTGSLGTATAFTSFSSVTVESVAGDYVGLINAPVTMSAFTFTPSIPTSATVTPLWKITATPTTSFDLTSTTLLFQSNTALLLEGSGVLHMLGKTDTFGTWTFSANTQGGTFSFSSSNGAIGVPDGGATVGLLGMAFMTVAFMRRHISA